MAIPLALPLVPLAPGAAAAAGTFFIGSAAYIAQQVYGFRAPARAPSIPRTDGKAGGATLKELIADVIAGARIPVALPPNPLGPQSSLGLAGVLAAAGFLKPRLAQLWGWFASRPKTTEPGPAVLEGVLEGTMPAPGNTLPGDFSISASAGTSTYYGNPDCTAPSTLFSPAATLYSGSQVVKVDLITENGSCGVKRATYLVTKADGSVDTVLFAQTPYGFISIGPKVTTAYDGPNAVPNTGAATALPLPSGYIPPTPQIAPSVSPTTSPLPVRVVPRPLAPPTTQPGGPVPIPGVSPDPVPTTPGPSAPPATAPRAPSPAVPLPLPDGTPTKDGAIVPQASAPVAVTPPDAHFPVPGAPPVTGNGPRPTPEGIAQELGRLEQKLARLSDPGPEGPGDGSDRLQLISDLIGRLIEFATSMTAGGGYSLSSPCELDENGNRIVSTVNYAGATNSIGVLSNKIDALAGVLQVHKDLKQPNCKQAPAVGQPVTVNFVQVD